MQDSNWEICACWLLGMTSLIMRVVFVRRLSLFFSMMDPIFSLLVKVSEVMIFLTSSMYSFLVSNNFIMKSSLEEAIFELISVTILRILDVMVVLMVLERLEDSFFKISIKI